VSFAAIKICVACQRVFIVVGVYFVMTQSGNFWIPSYVSNIDNRNSFFVSLWCSVSVFLCRVEHLQPCACGIGKKHMCSPCLYYKTSIFYKGLKYKLNVKLSLSFN
jgi:hypothetical protein